MSELVSPPSGSPWPHPAETRPVQEPVSADIPPQQPGQPRAATEAVATALTAGTTAGTMLAGRYRLTTKMGVDPRAGAEFWRAEDTVLQRDVAATVLRRLGTDPDDDPGWAERAAEMVTRALRSGSFEHRGCARLLDVLAPDGGGLPRGVLGVAVTEWVHGKSLAEAVSGGLLKPLTAARAVAPLAAAAESAHQHGLVLGCDHPQRVRISTDGRAQVGFAMPRFDTTPADDVRGLGAVLYTLLTAQWPLSRADAARAGLEYAERPVDEPPPAPSTRRPGVPVELDTLAAGTLGPETAPGHVHTAASVHALLAEVVAEDDRVALFPPAPDGAPADPDDVWQDRGTPVGTADPARRRKLLIGLVALAIAMVGVLGFVGVQLGAFFGGGTGPVIVVGDAPVGRSDAPVQPGPPDADQVVRPAGIDVYDVSGDPDNADKVARVIDGDPATGWRTAVYKQQFPAFKQGIGVMVSFASAVQLADLSIDSPSAGTVVEIRSAPSADAALADAPVIGRATLQAGTTRISLANSQPVTHVLVWITKLEDPGGELSAELDEIRFHRAAG